VLKIVDQKVNCVQSYGWLSAKGLAEIWLKSDFLAGSNSKAMQHITLKLTVGEYLKRDYVSTKFRQNPLGVMFFFVLIWHGMTLYLVCHTYSTCLFRL